MSDTISIVGIIINSILSLIAIYVSYKAKVENAKMKVQITEIENKINIKNIGNIESSGFKDCTNVTDCKSIIVSK